MLKNLKTKFNYDKETVAISAAMLSVPVSALAVVLSFKDCCKK